MRARVLAVLVWHAALGFVVPRRRVLRPASACHLLRPGPSASSIPAERLLSPEEVEFGQYVGELYITVTDEFEDLLGEGRRVEEASAGTPSTIRLFAGEFGDASARSRGDDTRVVLKEYTPGACAALARNERTIRELLRAAPTGLAPSPLVPLRGYFEIDNATASDKEFRAAWEANYDVPPPYADTTWLVFGWTGFTTVATRRARGAQRGAARAAALAPVRPSRRADAVAAERALHARDRGAARGVAWLRGGLRGSIGANSIVIDSNRLDKTPLEDVSSSVRVRSASSARAAAPRAGRAQRGDAARARIRRRRGRPARARRVRHRGGPERLRLRARAAAARCARREPADDGRGRRRHARKAALRRVCEDTCLRDFTLPRGLQDGAALAERHRARREDGAGWALLEALPRAPARRRGHAAARRTPAQPRPHSRAEWRRRRRRVHAHSAGAALESPLLNNALLEETPPGFCGSRRAAMAALRQRGVGTLLLASPPEHVPERRARDMSTPAGHAATTPRVRSPYSRV